MVRVEPIGERNRAFERDPTHQLRVHEVAGFASYLPDPLIAFVPALRGRVGQVHEERLRVGREVGELVGEAIDRIEELAVHVELPLVPRTVADPYRCAIAPTRQVGKLSFGEIVLSADSEHDLQVVAATDGGGG